MSGTETAGKNKEALGTTRPERLYDSPLPVSVVELLCAPAGVEPLSPLATPSVTRAVLDAFGLSTKKKLGQNFLVNDAILKKIVALAEVSGSDYVLEVGPGIGTLTIALLRSAARVVSVERDPDLPQVLAATTAPWADWFSLVSKDALDLQEEDVWLAKPQSTDAPQVDARMSGEPQADAQIADAQSANARSADAQTADARFVDARLADAQSTAAQGAEGESAALRPNKFVANLPYAVAATLILDYFQRFPWLESATIMVQREVADRIAASPGSKNYGAYTVKLGMYAQVVDRFIVSPNNFFPPPHVDSAVVRLDRAPACDETGAPLTPQEIEDACLMADAAFASRRKTLSNSFKTYFSGRGAAQSAVVEELPRLFGLAGIDARRRGETLSQGEFIRLARAYRAL